MAEQKIINRLTIFNFRILVYSLIFYFTFIFTGCASNLTLNEIESTNPEIDSFNINYDCDAAFLTSYVHAQLSGFKVDGTMVISNYSDQICVISPPVKIELRTSDGQLISDMIIKNPSLSLLKDEFLEISFSWQNVCKPLETDFYSMTLVSDRMYGKIISPLEDPNGNYIDIVPACIDENNKPQLTIINLVHN